VLSNNPYNGGTHLPDITAITPLFGPEPGGGPLFFVASRGHHADVGGITPGSMPAFSRTIADEGLLLDVQLIATDPDQPVQTLTFEAYMNKKLVRKRPMAHLKIFLKDMAHLLGLAKA
jgi:N-methylhydantoinase B/oxoprolinase/acetone carboxylase alpha subunit